MSRFLLAFVIISSIAMGAVAVGPELSAGRKRRALVIGIDGARGDLIYRQAWLHGAAPHLQDLMAQGRFAVCTTVFDRRCARAHGGAQTGQGFQWLTAPGWASVITGVNNSKTQVRDNGENSFMKFVKSSKSYPSFFKRLRDEIHLEVAATGVGAFLSSTHGRSIKAGILDYECDTRPLQNSSCNLDDRRGGDSDDPERDRKMIDWMKERLSDPQLGLVMGVLDQVDATGHSHGFGNNSHYLQAITQADRLVGELLAVVKERSQHAKEDWLIVVTSDHGGHTILNFGVHDSWPDFDSAVPFIVTTVGEGLPVLKELTYPVTQMDTHATVMAWFGRPSPHVDGRVQGLEF